MEQRDFDAALATFEAGIKKINNDYTISEHYPTGDIFSRSPNPKKYLRIVRTSWGQNSVHCFIDMSNGDVLKADGWKRPAKHARGNIFDEHNGLKGMGPYGPACLR